MAWKINYRYEIKTAGEAGADGATRLAINTGYGAQLDFTSALGNMTSFVRRFQATGEDVVGVLYGQPKGADAADTAFPLDAAYKVEQIYARVDTPDAGLRRRISRANTSATDTDELPDDLPEDADQLGV